VRGPSAPFVTHEPRSNKKRAKNRAPATSPTSAALLCTEDVSFYATNHGTEGDGHRQNGQQYIHYSFAPWSAVVAPSLIQY
jgi:hypothetical protein